MALVKTKVFKLRTTNQGEASAQRLTPSLTSAAMAPAATSSRAVTPRRSRRDRNKSSPPKSTNPSQRSLVAPESGDDSDTNAREDDVDHGANETLQGRESQGGEESTEDVEAEGGTGGGKRGRSESAEAPPTPSLDLYDMDAQEALRDAEQSRKDLRDKKRQKVDQQFKATGTESPLTDTEELERREAALQHVPAFTPIPPTQTQHPASPAPATAGSALPSTSAADPSQSFTAVHAPKTKDTAPIIANPVVPIPATEGKSKPRKNKKAKATDTREDSELETAPKRGRAKGKGKKKEDVGDDEDNEVQSEPEVDAATEALEASQFMADREEAAAEAQKHRFQRVVFKCDSYCCSIHEGNPRAFNDPHVVVSVKDEILTDAKDKAETWT
ncbi:hypothetical protein P7C70_g7666, partial [Phenoliferia sp. Uapishka_3]